MTTNTLYLAFGALLGIGSTMAGVLLQSRLSRRQRRAPSLPLTAAQWEHHLQAHARLAEDDPQPDHAAHVEAHRRAFLMDDRP